MSEQPDPNQQTGQEFDAEAAMAAQRVVEGNQYGENATAWIQDQEKGPSGVIKPNESKYNNMERAAQAAGPKAEARRSEMSAWSEKTGAYAEKAAREQDLDTKEAEIMDTQEDVSSAMSRAANRVGKYGQVIESETGKKTVIRATETGVEERGDGHIRGIEVDNFKELGGTPREKPDPGARQLRSPANINNESGQNDPNKSPFKEIPEDAAEPQLQ